MITFLYIDQLIYFIRTYFNHLLHFDATSEMGHDVSWPVQFDDFQEAAIVEGIPIITLDRAHTGQPLQTPTGAVLPFQ